MKIFLIGWFGAGNMGDEAILLSELLWLKKHLKEVDFSILSFDPERTQRLTINIPEVKKIVRMGSKKNIFQSDLSGLLKTFSEVDVVFIGGGGLFQDIYNYYPIPFFTVMALLTRLFRKRLVFYCQGIGPLTTRMGRILCRFAVNLAELISVRDAESKELLKELGVMKEISLAADPVLLLETVKNENVETLVSSIKLREKGPVIVVCAHELLPWNDRTKKVVAESLDVLVRTKQAQIVFLPLGIYKNRWIQVEQSDSVDVAASKKLAALMNESSFTISEEFSPQEVLTVMQQANLIISMRFHGLIMALNAGIPVVALSFRQESKLRNLMKRIGQGESFFEAENLTQTTFLKRMEYALLNGDGMKKHIAASRALLQAELGKCHELLYKTLMDT